MALFRLPRLLRYYNLPQFFDRLDQNLPFPMMIRLSRTINTMVYLVHLAGCAYYGFSKWEGIGSTRKDYFYHILKYTHAHNKEALNLLNYPLMYLYTYYILAFVFDGHGDAYTRCFYVGLKSAVSIGKNPKPVRDNHWEMMFMWIMWILGVFVFAILIGKYKKYKENTSKRNLSINKLSFKYFPSDYF